MDATLLHYGLLVLAGIWAAALNAVAGGGTFFTFPVLIFLGLPPTLANTTNKVSMWVGAAASIGGYLDEVTRHRERIVLLSLLAIAGSIGGSLLLLVTPADTFRAMVPWLMLAATLMFMWGRKSVQWLNARLPTRAGTSALGRACLLLLQCLIGLYGGFFGAGIGILLIALYELMGIRNLHEANGLKVLITTGVHGVSVLTFVVMGSIAWPEAGALSLGALVGGYYGAVFTKRLPQTWVRSFIIVYGLAVSAYFFIK